MAGFATSSIIITIIIITIIVISVSFRIMDTHVNNLSKLCCICSEAVIIGIGYSNAKTVYDYQIALATHLKIDINKDNEVSHWKISWCNFMLQWRSFRDFPSYQHEHGEPMQGITEG